MLYIFREVQAGLRPFFSMKTLIDLCMVPPLALIAYGACQNFGVTGAFMATCVGLAGYLGPALLDALFDRWRAAKAAKP